VVYAVDVGAVDAQAAARQAHGIMVSPESLPPVLDVMDHSAKVVRVDLAKHESHRGGPDA
jgi:hypothetical protein